MKRKRTYLILFLLLLILAGVTCFTYIYYFAQEKKVLNKTSSAAYESHYVMIAEDTSSSFWQSVYKSARKAAKKQDAYLELMGTDMSSEYTMADYIEIGIASKVDGILICPDGSKEVEEKIKEARDADIPVVTLLEDAPNSERISYVGINFYELGQLYGKTIARENTGDTSSVMVVQDEQAESAGSDMILNQIKSVVNGQNSVTFPTSVEAFNIRKNNAFDAEEAIRDIFVNTEDMPDILVCLNDVDSECASQAAVDYNQVGKITIIGYYTSQKVLESIRKGIISDTIALDTKSMGTYAIQALDEYRESGYASDYISIDLAVVNQENVEDYR